MPITLQSILQRSLRIAGITTLPGIIPNTDQFAELIPEMNAMLGGWNCNGHRIYSAGITEYALSASQKIYTIGPGAELNGPRPVRIVWANILSAETPTERQGLRITMDPTEWGRIAMQDDTSATVGGIYYDNSFSASGYGRIYLHPQAQTGATLELFSWLAIASAFTAVSDVVYLPPGYEDATVWNFALRVAGIYPLHAKLSPVAPEMAARTLQAIMTLNMRSPILRSEAAHLNGFGGAWLSGSYTAQGGGSGSGMGPTQFSTNNNTITGTIDGSNATFVLATPVTTVNIYRSGVLMTISQDVTFTGTRTMVFQPGQIPQSGDVITAQGWA